MNSQPSGFATIFAAILSAFPCVHTAAALDVVKDSKAAPLVSVQDIPEITLRGYGKVSGRYFQFNGGSILEITCQDAEKAKLTQAKYLSDAQVLPGVTPARSGPLPGALEVRGEGAVAAIHSGDKVFLLAATSPANLEKLAANALNGDIHALASTAEAKVPMWLDKWDKYGYRQTNYDIARMYMPPKSDRNKFDFFKPLEWMKSINLGFAIDPLIGREDFAEGIVSDPFVSWMENASAELGIPFNLRSTTPKIGATSTWFANRHIDAMQQKAPYYVGNFASATPDYGWGNNSRTLAWSAGDVEDEYLSVVQQGIRNVAHYPNLINYNYPQQEVAHGYHDMLVELGPVADASYQKLLNDKYGSIANLSMRWYGAEDHLRNWRDVHVPELAEFEGWSPGAVTIGGEWKVKRLAENEEPPADWNKSECADSGWETVRTPGDWMMFGGYKSPGSPAVFRIHFDVKEGWLGDHGSRRWLYVWDLNPWNTEMALSVNGGEIVHDKGWPYVPHWVAIDVTEKIHAGSNQLALLLPKGFIGYRVYLSGEAPKQYPFLGREANARWVDFMDWRTACRAARIHRGVEAIRQVDPNKPIGLDAPHYLLDQAREISIEMGCFIHDTGGLAGSWNVYEPMLAQGADLPYSLELGNGPHSVVEFQQVLGRCVTEGIQSVETVCPDSQYLYYNSDVRKCVEDNMSIAGLIGKYHVPPAKVAFFMSNREVQMLAYPWRPDASKVLSMGYFGWHAALEYPSAGVMESDFLKDRAGKFAVIIDTNTQIMDEKTVEGIERYARNGGVFVTLGQTGRHTELDADSWPISRLTGYKVTAIDLHRPDGGEVPRACGLDDPLPGNGVFEIKRWQDNPAYLDNVRYASGLSLEKAAPDCRDLIKWKDGTTAAGIRPLGKGYIIDMGVVFGRYGGSFLMKKLLEDIVLWRGVKERTPGQIYPPVIADAASLPKDFGIVPGSVYLLSAVGMACQHQFDHDFDGFPWAYKKVIFRHYQSNNDLFDVWALFNTSEAETRTLDLTFRDGLRPAFGFDVKARTQVAVSKEDGLPQIKGIQLQPLETKVFLTPRSDITRAGLGWFDLQRQWWRTSYKPGAPFPAVPHKFTVDLYDNWAFMPLNGKSDAEIAGLASPGTDDTQWEHRPLGIWTTPKKQNVRHGLLRRWVEIPKSWDKGTIRFWFVSWYMRTFYDHGWVYIDGLKLSEKDAFLGNDFSSLFQPGSRHLIAIEVKSDGQLAGVAGDCWFYYTPEPVTRTSLAGKWTTSDDMIHYGDKVSLPGMIHSKTVRREDVMLDASQKGKNVLLYVDSDNRIHGALVNGHWVCRFHHCIGTYLELNITPWVKFDEPNQIELTDFKNTDAKAQTRTTEIRYYNPGEYP